ncbi:MAG: glutaryl-CoA dehydrogenase Acd [Thermodesulfobacteriota bacterium]
MDFSLSEDHRAIQDAVRRFAHNEIAPHVQQWEEQGMLPREVLGQMAEMGLFGCLLPERYGGTDYGFLAMALITEELSKASSSLRGAMNMQCNGTAYNIYKHGSEELKQKHIPALINAEKLGCFAITEPDVGSDVMAISTRATAQGDHYLLSGTKTWISFAPVADLAVVYACTNPEARRERLSAFLVDMHSPGITTSTIPKMGSHAFPTGEIVFDEVLVPRENLLGQEGQGAEILFGSLPVTRIGVAAGAVGLAQACLEEAVKYCQQRKQFGQAIANFQMNQSAVAEIATAIEAARLLAYRAAWQRDHGVNNNVLEISYAKMFAANVAMQAANTALDLHGAYGYAAEYPVSRFFREAKFYQIVEGTPNIHRLIIGQDWLGLRKANR